MDGLRDFIYQNKRWFLVAGVVFLLVSATLYLQQEETENLPLPTYQEEMQPIIQANPVEKQQKQGSNPDQQKQEQKVIVVDVKGAVIHPGVYTLAKNSRIHHAIKKAGGLGKKADIMQVNLAAPLSDGVVVYIPEKTEQHASFQPGANGQAIENEQSTAHKININQANAQQLQEIKGIGRSIAMRIIEYRKENGSFQSVHDLLHIRGIGEKTITKMEPYISVR